MTLSWPLDDVVLDPRAREPLHAQLAAAVRSRIRDRRLQPGETLPSDAQLQERFSVSRSVVRQAMNSLVAEGAVLRSRGRGSVVAPHRQHHRLAHRAAGLSSQVADTGSDVRTRVLNLGRQQASVFAAELREDQPVYLERLRSIDGLPAAYIRTWLPSRFGDDLTCDELTDSSLHRIVENRHGIELTGGSRQVRAVSADEELARLLSTRRGAPLLLLEGTTVTSDGTVVEVFSTWHRGDLITFDLDVEGGLAPGARAGDGAAEAPPDRQALQQAKRSARRLLEQLEDLG